MASVGCIRLDGELGQVSAIPLLRRQRRTRDAARLTRKRSRHLQRRCIPVASSHISSPRWRCKGTTHNDVTTTEMLDDRMLPFLDSDSALTFMAIHLTRPDPPQRLTLAYFIPAVYIFVSSSSVVLAYLRDWTGPSCIFRSCCRHPSIVPRSSRHNPLHLVSNARRHVVLLL